MNNSMYLYGASGHAKVIIEILELNNIKISGLFDDNPAVKELLGYLCLGSQKTAIKNDQLIISIGNNYLRKLVSKRFDNLYGSAIHPTAVISNRSAIGAGTVVMGNVIINTGSIIGKHVILNTSASVDHDCRIEDYVHISPNATLCGGVRIGEGSHIGAAAVIIPNVSVGRWSIVGAGAVIIHDVPDNVLVVGNPGRIVKTLEH